jgi:hypothetical protein
VPIVKVNSQSRMRITTKLTFTLILMACVAGVASAQVPTQRPSPTPHPRPIDGQAKTQDNNVPLTTFEEEIRAKREIKMAEKDHKENLERAREIALIGQELKESLGDKAILDRNCLKRIERLEKLTKKVRGEAGGDDQEITIQDKPANLAAAAEQIADASKSLSKEVHDTPRRVVSASVIGNANVLLELIRLARTFVAPKR